MQAGRAPRRATTTRRLRPVMELIRELCARRDLAAIIVEKAGFRLALAGEASVARSIKGFMFDLDGTLVLGDRTGKSYDLLPGAVEVLSTLDRARHPLGRDDQWQCVSGGRTGAAAARARACRWKIPSCSTPSSVTADVLPATRSQAGADPRVARRGLTPWLRLAS